ncbi:MAG TPA: hypothetical protein VFZ34_22850 [Blastocatellia bacterium]|nr:hypothetical protein [Blastocatellia bacterium]
MKNQLLSQFAFTALILLFSALTAPAHSLDNLLTLQIPFDFRINGKLLPAGEYSFKRIPTMPEVLIIEGSDSTSVTALTVFYGSPEASTRFSLTFNEYGAQRFLAEVKIAHGSYQYAVVKSKAERELAASSPARIIRLLPAKDHTRTNENQ